MALLTGLVFPLQPAAATVTAEGIPTFAQFVISVRTGQAGVITGVYVPGLFAYPVVAQPANDPGYVSTEEDVLTHFSMPDAFNVIGLLAHNNLAGASFADLSVGQEIRVVYGDGRVDYYQVTQAARFQALQPTNPNSTFFDSTTDKYYSAVDIFKMFYTGLPHLTFQTCIARGGEASWGRLFITAVPVRMSFLSSIFSYPRAWLQPLEVRN